MAVVIDMLAGVLSGSGFGAIVDTPEGAPLVGSNFVALKIDAFCDPEEFRRNVDALIDEILSVRREEETPRVYMPGEIEFEREAENMDRGGVPLQPDNRFYILGLAPNASRLSVRFFLENSFRGFLENLNRLREAK